MKNIKISNLGYLPFSPDRYEKSLIIPSNILTMQGVPHDVLAVADNGKTKLMKKNSGLHKFTGANSVLEIPILQEGGSIVDYLSNNNLDSSFSNRKKLAKQQGINNYKGTAEQNLQLLNNLKNNKVTKTFELDKVKKNKQALNLINASDFTNDFLGFDGRKLESGVITDKATNITYVLDKGKIIKQFPVLTGVNKNVSKGSTEDVDSLRKNPNRAGTPTGVFELEPDLNLYGEKGFRLNSIEAFGETKNSPTLAAYHTTYNPSVREPLYNKSSDERRVSLGCINCQKPNINYITDKFPQGDTSIIIDSDSPRDLKFLNKVKNIKKDGGNINQFNLPHEVMLQLGGMIMNDRSLPKYQNGGRQPIIVNNPNDPRLRAYQDSLSLYNNSQANIQFLKKLGYKVDEKPYGIEPLPNGLTKKHNRSLREQQKNFDGLLEYYKKNKDKKLGKDLFYKNIKQQSPDKFSVDNLFTTNKGNSTFGLDGSNNLNNNINYLHDLYNRNIAEERSQFYKKPAISTGTFGERENKSEKEIINGKVTKNITSYKDDSYKKDYDSSSTQIVSLYKKPVQPVVYQKEQTQQIAESKNPDGSVNYKTVPKKGNKFILTNELPFKTQDIVSINKDLNYQQPNIPISTLNIKPNIEQNTPTNYQVNWRDDSRPDGNQQQVKYFKTKKEFDKFIKNNPTTNVEVSGDGSYAGATMVGIPEYQIGGSLPKYQEEGLVKKPQPIGGYNNGLADWGGISLMGKKPQPVTVPYPLGYKPQQTNEQVNTVVNKDVVQGQPLGNSVSGLDMSSMFLGALTTVNNNLQDVPEYKMYNQTVNRGTTDASFGTVNPMLNRGYTDINSGMVAPNQKTVNQFSNRPVNEFYGTPIAQDGTEFTAMPNIVAPLIQNPDNFTSYIPQQNDVKVPNAIPKSTNPSEDFYVYMSHQQGLGGIKALKKAAETGKHWSTFYKGKEDLDKNMRNNITQSEFYKKYNVLNPANFLDYWSNKYERKAKVYANKVTPYDDYINQVAPQYGFTPQSVKTMIGAESDFDPNNRTGSYRGLLQLGPDEAKEAGVKNVYDPIQNILGGLKTLSKKKASLSKQTFKEGGQYIMNDADIKRLQELGYELEVR